MKIGLTKFQVQTNIKNVDGLLKWNSGMATLQVYASRFQQVLHNYLLRCYFIYSSISDTYCHNIKVNNNFHARQEKKTQEKIELLLEQVVRNSRVFFPHSKNPQIF